MFLWRTVVGHCQRMAPGGRTLFRRMTFSTKFVTNLTFHCTEISYTVDLGDAKIVCLWDLVQDSSGNVNPSVFRGNREATIYFLHVRGAA